MERDRGAAHSLEPGKDSLPGRNQEPVTASSALRPPAALLSPPSALPLLFWGRRYRKEERGWEGGREVEAK